MYTTYADDIDAFNLRRETHDFNDMYDLIHKMGGEQGLNATDQAYVASTLKGYSQWSDVGTKYEAAVQLGLKVADFNVQANGISKSDMTEQFLTAIYNGEIDGHTIDIDTALRIRPSAITIDATGVHVDDSAVEAAVTKTAMAKKQEKLGQIEAIQKVDKGGVITKEQYSSLWDSGYFETREELFAYASQSPETRALQMRQEQERLNTELIADNAELIRHNRDELVEAEEDLNAYYIELERFLSNKIANGWTAENHAWAFDESG